MRADRLLSLLWLLRSHASLTTRELAERLEVSQRTILRDIDALSASGVPVYCERGANGGVRLLDTYRTDVTAFTPDEAHALLAAITPWEAQSVGEAKLLGQAVAKLTAALPTNIREPTQRSAGRIVIDPQGWLPSPKADSVSHILPKLHQAVDESRSIQITYHAAHVPHAETKEWTPLGLVASGAEWYLAALPRTEVGNDSEDVRFLKLTRIEKVGNPGPCITRPEIDLQKLWEHRKQEYRNRFHPLKIEALLKTNLIEVTGEHAINLEPTRGNTKRIASLCSSYGLSPSLWSGVSITFMDTLHALTVLLPIGPDVIVIKPAWFVAEIRDHAQAIADRYSNCCQPETNSKTPRMD